MGRKKPDQKKGGTNVEPKVNKDIRYYEELLKNPNVIAFLQVIRKAEGTLGELGYHRLVGAVNEPGKRRYFEYLGKHPNIYFANMDSRAAGAYQIINDTWSRIARKLGLNDFGEHNQDIAALRLIDENRNHAIDDVLNGDPIEASKKLNRVWASLYGAKKSEHNKHTLTYKDTHDFYEKSGGVFHYVWSDPPMAPQYLGSKWFAEKGLQSKPKNLSHHIEIPGRHFSSKELFQIPEIQATAPVQKDKTNVDRLMKQELKWRAELNKHPEDTGTAYSFPSISIGSLQTFDTLKFGAVPLIKTFAELRLERNKLADTVNRKAVGAANKDRKASRKGGRIKSGKKTGLEFESPYNNKNGNDIDAILPDIGYRQANDFGYRYSSLLSNQYSSVVQKPPLQVGKEISTVFKDPLVSRTAFNEASGFSRAYDGRQSVAINLHAPLINSFSITTQNIGEGITNVKQQVEQALLEVLNNAVTV